MANVVCPSCGAAGRVPDNFIGRRIKCPKCQEPFTAAVSPAKPAAPPSRPAASPSSKALKPPAKAGGTAPPSAPGPVARRRAPAAPPPPAEDELEVLDEEPLEEGEELGAEEPLGEPVPSGGGMQYFRPLGYLRNNPGWFGNAFLAGIAGIIPIVGVIVLYGYLFEVVRRINRKGDDSYPSFEFGRFSDYLKLGIWPFLAVFIVAFVITIVSNGLQFGLSMVVHSSAVGGIGAIFGIVELFLIVPFALHAGLSRSLSFGGMLAFLKDFYKRVLKEAILGYLALGLINFVLYFLGVLACCVGLIPVLGLVTLTTAHLFSQLYQLYLQRGGQPITAG